MILSILFLMTGLCSGQYVGKRLGALAPLDHEVKGEVFAVDSRTLHIRGFSYDGSAPDAFFYGGLSGQPSDDGFIIPDENGSKDVLGRYKNKDVTLSLPKGVTLKDLRWISIWCRAFTVNFGHLLLPAGLKYPRPQKITALSTLDHGVRSDRVVVVDAQTFLIPNFSYDGTAPDAFFWVGTGQPGRTGTKVADENGSTEPLRSYDGKTLVITLSGSLTVFDIDYLSVWCKAFTADFGNVRIPRNLNVPPSLKMLGVAPQTKLNCEVLDDSLAFEVRWAVAGESIVMQLVGRLDDGLYMSFGLSGSPTRSQMVGGDVVTAWLESSGRGFAQDYHLDAKSQCQGGRGACPDTSVKGTEDVRLLNAALINGFTMITFQRPLLAADKLTDKQIFTNASQPIIWAVGPVNSQGHPSYHSARGQGDSFIEFGRSPTWNCPLPDEHPSNKAGQSVARGRGQSQSRSRPRGQSRSPSKPKVTPWKIPAIPCHEPKDGIIYAQIGPSGGEAGYNSITGRVGWGIAYYMNGLLIPEINVVRGKTYTFVVESGHNPNNPAKSHPLYLTDDPEGGYAGKSAKERAAVKVFAGVDIDGVHDPIATAYGRLCEWKPKDTGKQTQAGSFGAFQRTLNLDCEKEGQAGILQWTPDASTPNTLYYQCYTHRHLGWKIHVHDSCPTAPTAAPKAAPATRLAPSRRGRGRGRGRARG